MQSLRHFGAKGREAVSDWIETKKNQPEEHVVVETKIDDVNGCRNEQKLYRQGGLWFIPDGSMYVYYRPTHWRSI